MHSINLLKRIHLFSSIIPTATPTVAGVISTIAGTGSTTFSGDNGAATSGTMRLPMGIAVDSSGNNLSKYILMKNHYSSLFKATYTLPINTIIASAR